MRHRLEIQHDKSRVLVWDSNSKLFFAAVEVWTADLEEALNFETVGRAHEFIRRHPQRDLRIFEPFVPDEGEQWRVPLAG